MYSRVLVLLALSAVAFAIPRALWGSHLPTEGGRTVLNGHEFHRTLSPLPAGPTDAASIEVVLGGIPCTGVRVHSDTQLSCNIPPNTGGCGLVISVVSSAGIIQAGPGLNSSGFVNAPGYSYMKPVIEEYVPIMPTGPTMRRLTLKGRNFGLTNINNTMRVSLLKRDGAPTTRPYETVATEKECTNVQIVTAHSELRCDFDATNMTGDYYIRVNVSNCFNDYTRQPQLTLGKCYQLQSISTDDINTVLIKRALEKNIKRLQNLRTGIATLKRTLPPFDENNCCGGDHEYLVSLMALAAESQESLQFKDCLHKICTSSDTFNDRLLGLNLA